jgi:G3E family GTPase
VSKPKVILVGGFLGAGKTTLLTNAAAQLIGRRKKVGIITNDQAAGLVDTQIVKQVSPGVREVAGGCFCCKFGDLILALKQVFAEFTPDIVFAEPVGSCTDLSATVLQPLKKLYAEMLTVAPYSVLTDPARLREALTQNTDSLLPQSVHYIFRKQLEEADLIILNKADLLTKPEIAALEALVAERLPGRPMMTLSALNDRDVAGWLTKALQGTTAGATITDVDYDTYAEGEAELGWLNATVEVSPESGADLPGFVAAFLDAMRDALRAKSADIAHLKVMLTGRAGSITGNLTSLGARASVRGSIPAHGEKLKLLVNARVHVAPDVLRATVEECLSAAAAKMGAAAITNIESFRPGRPQPTHRFDKVV